MKIIDNIRELNHARIHGFPKGVYLGDPELDKYLNFMKGNTLYFHAYPQHGKTTFVHWFHVRLAKKYGWRIKMYDGETGSSTKVFYKLIECWCECEMRNIDDAMYKEAVKAINKHFDIVTESTYLKDFLTELEDFDAVSIDHMGNVRDFIDYNFIHKFLFEFNTLMKNTNTHGTIVTHSKKDIKFLLKQVTPEGDTINFYPPAAEDRMWMGQSWDKFGNNIIHLWRPKQGMINSQGELYDHNECYLYTQKIKPEESGKKNEIKGIKLKYWNEHKMYYSEEFHRLNHVEPIKPNENFLEEDEIPF